MNKLGSIFLVVICAVGLFAFGGFVTSVMWYWFVVPVFELPPLSIPQAIGISLFIGVFRPPVKSTENSGSPEKAIFAVLAQLTALLAMGLIVQLFV